MDGYSYDSSDFTVDRIFSDATSINFNGDFYRQPDDVSRGVTMAFAGDELELDYYGKPDFMFPEDKDWNRAQIHAASFYKEPKDVTSGVTMSAADLMSFQKSDQECGLPALRFVNIDATDAAEGSTNHGRAERFHVSDEPPVAPDDDFFTLEDSTVFVMSDRPWEIGNHLLDFLNTQTISKVTKVTRAKFAIKAEVFVDYSAMCSLKARVYRQEGKYAVEFQRRSGSQATFNKVYQLAKAFLNKHCVSDTKVEQRVFHSALKGLTEACSIPAEEVDLTPLLEMASLSTQPSQQAEAAMALADAAKDDGVSALLRTSQAFEEVALKLLESDRMDISYPTACLLHTLAKCPEAEAAFANSAIKPMIQQKVQSQKTSQHVRHLLVKALNLTGTSCRVELLKKAKFACDPTCMIEVLCQ